MYLSVNWETVVPWAYAAILSTHAVLMIHYNALVARVASYIAQFSPL